MRCIKTQMHPVVMGLYLGLGIEEDNIGGGGCRTCSGVFSIQNFN